jgi:hypothetical protein
VEIDLSFVTRRERVFLVLAAVAVVANMLDAVATLTWVELGWAEEANPVMAALLGGSSVAFMVGKLAMVSCGVYACHRYAEALRLARAGLVVAASVYVGICAVFHAPAAGWLLGG